MKLPFLRKSHRGDDPFKCPGCKSGVDAAAARANLSVCPECGYHFLMSCRERVESLLDADTFRPLAGSPVVVDPLEFRDARPYTERLAAERAATGQDEMAVAGAGELRGRPVAFAATDIHFLRGSMGVAAGELVTAAIEYAIDHDVPLVLAANSAGGVRIHEGMFALMQMAKTASAMERLRRAGGLSIAVLANPTMGGVMASFAALTDITLAEPDAAAGFTSAHLIRAAVEKDLPDDFQTAPRLLERGFLDAIVPRPQLRSEIARVLDLCLGPPPS